MPSTNNDNPSPSASSIFLPLGRRVRRDSKSSLSTELDQDALNEVLDTIHTAASQSQVLTVFNEYTDPPSGASKDDGKTITADIQGGLSGLYNKLKASVGVASDVSEPRQSITGRTSSHERSISKTSSGKASTVQSPKLGRSEVLDGNQLASQTSKLSSKAASISKVSQSTPPVKSPTGPPLPSSLLADAAISEINALALNTSVTHSRNGSTFESSEGKEPIRSSTASMDGEPLQRSASHSIRTDSRLASPVVAPTKQPMVHARADSESSFRDRPGSRPLSPNVAQGERIPDRIAQGRQERVPPRPQQPNPLDLLGEQSSHAARSSAALSPRIVKDNSRASKSPAPLSRPKERLLPQISQSRLPGFAASHASSTDSVPTAVLSRAQVGAETDGSLDKYVERQTSRPADKLRSKLLNREFWMRDENARDCFHCGEPFTTFRRKHHCRTCGQIFDNKCTVLISGSNFGSMGAIRVCKPCEAIIISHDDDSSDYSVESMALPDSLTRPRTPDPAQLLHVRPIRR